MTLKVTWACPAVVPALQATLEREPAVPVQAETTGEVAVPVFAATVIDPPVDGMYAYQIPGCTEFDAQGRGGSL